MKNYLLFLLSFFLCVLNVSAQKYEIECARGDSANVYPASIEKMDYEGRVDTFWNVASEEVAFRIAEGEIIEAIGRKDGSQNLSGGFKLSYLIFKKDGKLWGVSTEDVVFSDENPEGVKDRLLSENDIVKHTLQGKLFRSYIPYIIIALLFLGVFLFSGYSLKHKKYLPMARIVIPAGILVGSLLEIWAYSVLGTECFGWCDREHFGFWSSLLSIIPFALIVLYQCMSIKIYEQILFGEDFNGDVDDGISIKPALYSILGVVPAVIVVALIQLALGLNNTILGDIIILIGGLAALLGGVLLSAKRNSERFGSFKMGLAVTIFGIIYIIGCIVAVWGLIVVVFKLIIQIIMIAVAIGFIFFVLPKDIFSSNGGGGGGASQPMWRDEDGGMHVSRGDAERANERIAERKRGND